MMMTNSPFLGRTCADCINFLFDDDGKVKRHKRSRNVIKRPAGTVTPCHKCPKILQDAPEKSYYFATEVTDATWQTIQHYEECDVTKDWPRTPDGREVDPIVKKNAAKIKRLRDQHDKEDMKAMILSLSIERLFK